MSMKGLAFCCCAAGLAPLAALCAAIGEGGLPRNPFWPQGFEGTRYAISAEPRFKPKVEKAPVIVARPADAAGPAGKGASASAAPAAPANPLEDPLWDKAVKALRFGSALGFSLKNETHASIMINGRAYAAGDLVSANVADRRFTWKIEGLSPEGKIRLKRIAFRKIGTQP